MLPHPRTAVPRLGTWTGLPCPRRLSSLLRAALFLVIVLCAVAHGTTEKHHAPTPAAVTALATTPGGAEPHTPQHSHGAEECTPDATLRTTAQAPEQPPASAAVVIVAAVAGATAPRSPPAPGAACGRRTRNGRAALVRTSRWRI
ncbi:hypothetical protein [Streptomyces turgidiscabies]|uniref:Secreted protein n=1 Tax=Streptomyces turgidiscabies TaxID=85558 RepID=A0ABU0RID1_9ACTN|nr:hypothetical protein [Streptomyces turgidiscabies]MDQ0931483.1 hypothetical protein [Streptomyces turgidiscabies]